MRYLIVILSLAMIFTALNAVAESCKPSTNTYTQGCDCVFIPFPPHQSCKKTQSCTTTVTCGANGASSTSTTCGECK